MKSFGCFLVLLFASASARHRLHRDLENKQRLAVLQDNGIQHGQGTAEAKGARMQYGLKNTEKTDGSYSQKTKLIPAKGGGYQEMPGQRPINSRPDNPTCSSATNAEDDGLSLTCSDDFPSVGQLRGVQSLTVVNADIGALIRETYISCTTLTTLTVSTCGITSVNIQLSKTTANLVKLDLSGNKLAVIRQTTLQGLVRLKTLNLARNEIALLEPGSFDSNECLEYLDLSHNFLMEFPSGLPISLVNIVLFNNRIQQLTNPVSLPELVVLNLCSNNVVTMSALECPKLETLCVGAVNLAWDYKFLQASSLDSLSDVVFVSNAEQNVFPVNILRFLQSKLLHRLTIQNYDLTQLYLPATLTHLSLVEVKLPLDIDAGVLKVCASQLVRLDLSHSNEIANAFISSTSLLGELKRIKQLILTGCGIRTLSFLDISGYFPELVECNVSRNALDCTEKATKRVLCNANKEGDETVLNLILDSVTCSPSGQPFDYAMCTSEPPKHEEVILGPGRVIGHPQETVHEDGQGSWGIWIIIIAIAASLLILFAILLTCYCCKKKKKNKYGEVAVSEEITKSEAKIMLKKGAN